MGLNTVVIVGSVRSDRQGLKAAKYAWRLGVFDFGVVRTFRSAVSGRPEGLHYIGVENAIGTV